MNRKRLKKKKKKEEPSRARPINYQEEDHTTEKYMKKTQMIGLITNGKQYVFTRKLRETDYIYIYIKKGERAAQPVEEKLLRGGTYT